MVLCYDTDFENIILFQHYVYVLYPDSSVMVDGGYVTHFDKDIVVINGLDY
ncbi:hypothetical protein SAMN04487897_102525 [Paenibacillus sp. yr247]|uniref:hypothetical protein n=1 Tax=Paenibacillus sp. yr247 TaxID=1761880 RepID=UPI00088E897B|nr:hypothetical protein [Paenibacillus sp. yr247]SDN32908.1 hypothetical protein SAMN04487897_102525 [Paenibacillus sp. yr247]